MGRTKKEEALAMLKHQLEVCKNSKKLILKHIRDIDEKHNKQELTFKEREELLSEVSEGRTLNEWINYYDAHIKKYEREINLRRKRKNIKKISFVFLSFILIALVLFSFFYIRPNLIGKSIEEISEQISDNSQESATETLADSSTQTSSETSTQESESYSEINQEEPQRTSPSQETPLDSETKDTIQDTTHQESESVTETLANSEDTSTQTSSESSTQETTNETSTQESESYSEINQEEPQRTSPSQETPLDSETENITEEQTNQSEKTNQTQEQTTQENLTDELIKDENIFNQSQLNLSSNVSLGNLSINENISLEEIVDNLTIENATIITIQYNAVINQPVKWKKTIIVDSPKKIKVKLPKDSTNINVNKILDSYSEINQETLQRTSPSHEGSLDSETSLEEENEKQKAKFSITGQVIEEDSDGDGIIYRIINFFKKLSRGITGRAIEEENQEEIEVTLEDNATVYEIEYETEAPKALEQEMPKGKRITVSGPDELHYENILAYTNLSQETPEDKIRLYHITENGTEETEIQSYDTNENGLVDYIEWIVPHLSNQTYELIIEISKAEHLDSNKSFISDVYDIVKAQDNIWLDNISDGEYLRVSFEKLLDNTRDITLYARGNGNVQVYENEGREVLIEFNINSERLYKDYLTSLQGSQDTFDLKIIGDVDIDYVVDPLEYLNVTNYTTSVLNWVVPEDISVITIEAFGGGGAGGGSGTNAQGGSGGGGGQVAIKNISVSPGQKFNISIGAGGTPGAAGNNPGGTGGNTTFSNGSGNLVVAIGGSGGAGNSGTIGLGNLSGSIGDIIRWGGSGGIGGAAGGGGGGGAGTTVNGTTTTTSTGGAGGSLYGGTGGNGATNANGNPGNNYSAGGGGGEYGSPGSRSGGAGAQGFLRITLYQEDKSAPVIMVLSPTNSSTYGSNLSFNVSLNENTSWCGLSLDSISNADMIKFNSTYFYYINSSMAEGLHNVTFACNDTSGNMNYSSGYIYFYVDTTAPNIDFINPTPESASTQSGNSIFVNVSSTDVSRGGKDITTFIDFDNSLVSWWRMDDVNASGDVVDYMGLNNGTAFGNAEQISYGKFGKSFNFDGNGDYTSITANQFPDSNKSRTISFWIKSYYTNYSISHFSLGTSGPGNGNWFMINWENDSISMTFGGHRVGTEGQILSLNTWYNVIVRVPENANNTDNVELWINGVNQTLQDLACSGCPHKLNTTWVASVIGGNGASYPSNLFNGTIDDVMIFNRSLSVEEIGALYANASTKYFKANFSSLSEGTYTFKAYVQDEAGNLNYTEMRSVIINYSYTSSDTTAPGMTIVYPANTSYGFNVSEINYTYTESHSAYCWYSKDSGVTNSTPTQMGNNFTEVISSEGSNTWTLYCNNTEGYENSTNITFFKETASNVTFCRNLTQANMIYTIQNNIIAAGTCFNILAENITLDLNGYIVNTSTLNQGHYGVSNFLGYDYLNVINGSLYQFGIGIYSTGDYGNFSNLNISAQGNYGLATIVYGIHLINSNYNSLYKIDSSNLTNSGGGPRYTRGIYLTNSSNNNLTNLNISFNDYGLGLGANSSNNQLKDIAADLNRMSGISITTGSGNNMSDIHAYSNVQYAIQFSSTLNNSLDNMTSWNCSNGVSSSCIYIYRSNGNIIENVYINFTINSGKGIYIQGDSSTSNLSSSNNLLRDILIENINGQEVNVNESLGDVLNNTFINVSYNASNEIVIGSNVSLIRKWYLDFNVTNSSGSLEGANVTIWNASNTYLISELTNSTGEIERQEIIEYINNGTRKYSTPHTINTSKAGYTTNSTQINLTSFNNFVHSVFLIETDAPNITLLTPANQTITSNTTINFTANISDYGSGIKNVTLWIFNTTGLYNKTVVEYGQGIFNVIVGVPVVLVEGVYNWFVEVWDYASNFAKSDTLVGNYSLIVDTTNSMINFTSPTP
ncbi:MAG: LamG-like jellyroll fold domain-containing protein, partial [Candidatus Nanoarchaeia archaeon]